MRARYMVFSALVLGACQMAIPDSGAGAGVGFDDYSSYAARTEAELAGSPAAAAPVISTERAASGSTSSDSTPIVAAAATPVAAAESPAVDGISSNELAAAGIGNSNQLEALLGEPATTAASNEELSDEQDFDAVASRETVESDAERIAQQRQVYQVIEPKALPTRLSSGGPNIVAFALETSNQVGQPIYSRSLIFAESRFLRSCGKFASPDQAQEAFLAAGGPKRDRKGMDPDGDGFACAWDPAPFRLAAQN
jgi:hypothetical protein